MTISANNFTFDHVPGVEKSVTVHFHTTDPGVFVCTYPDGITGPPTVEAAGTRVWRNGLKHGQYLAREGASTAQRVNCAWFLEINTADLSHINGGVNNDYTVIRAVYNFKSTSVQRTNYALYLHSAKTLVDTQYILLGFNASNTNILGETDTPGAIFQLSSPDIIRSIWTYDGSRLKFYSTPGTAASTDVARSISGTMGSDEILSINFPCKFAKLDSIPSQAEREAFMASGTLPAGLAVSIQGGNEINPAAPVFYDTSGNGLDLSDVDVQYWPEAAASGDYTDTGFTSPLVEVPITIAADCAAGVHEITLRRNRVGIPVRVPPLSDAELYDDGTIPVTIVEPATWVKVGPSQEYQVYLP